MTTSPSDIIESGFQAIWARLREENPTDAVHNLRTLLPMITEPIDLWRWLIFAELGGIVFGANWPRDELVEMSDNRAAEVCK